MARKLAGAAFVLSLLCALVSTGFLISLEYTQGRQKIVSELTQQGRTSAASVALSLWEFDTKLLKAQLEGLSKLPYIAYAKVNYDEGTIELCGSSGASDAVPVSFDLVHWNRGKAFDLGTLLLCPDYGSLKSRLWVTTGRILAFQLFLALTMGLVLFILFYTFVGRHLEAIANQAKGLSPICLDQPISLARRAEEGQTADELDVLVNALNSMRINLKHSIGQQRKADERHRVLFETMHQGVVYHDAEGKIISANPAALRILGVTMEQILGRVPVDSGWQWVTESLSPFPESEYPVRVALTRARQVAGMVMGVSTQEGGMRKWVSVTATPLFRDGESRPYLVHVTFEDISRLRRTEEHLQASHERFLTVLNSIEAFVYVTDLNSHKVLFMNQFMKDHFGTGLTGNVCYRAFDAEGFPCADCRAQSLLDASGAPMDVQVRTGKSRASGKWYIHQNRAIRWTVGNYARLHIATDITELKEMEADLRQAQKMESVGTLAGGVAHDFNNILSIILGNAELAVDDLGANHPAISRIKEIRTASLRAKGVIQHLLNFSRKTEVARGILNMARLLEESMTLLRSTIPSNIELRASVREENCHISADSNQIHQVIMNLCTNACQAMMETGGTIEIALQQVCVEDGHWHAVRSLPPGDYLELAIRDNGPGIPEPLMERIFDPYFTTKEVGQGTGLGLSVVQGIVQGHNGFIHVQSRQGQGSAFLILFPSALPADHRPDIDAGDEPATRGVESVLVVDDESGVAEVLRQFLRRLGYQVDVETDPVMAAGLFSGEPVYDLLITDMTMPKMTGLDLVGEIRRRGDGLPVIICTGHSPLMDDPRVSELDITAFAMKPVGFSDLSKLVRDALDRDKA